MSNPNLVRKVNDNPTGGAGEISQPNILSKSARNRNALINGDMRFAQRGTSWPAMAAGNTFITDRWLYGKTGSSAVHTGSQDSDVPTFAQSGYNLRNSYRLNLTTADTAVAAGDLIVAAQQRIEGYHFNFLANKQATLSFWVKATTIGTYCVAFGNNNDASYIAEYSINVSNTWEYKTITLTLSTGLGTWNFTNGTGLKISWVLAGGTSFQGTANAWIAGDLFCTSNQVNGANTGSTDFRLTGVMLNEGPDAAPFALFGRSHFAELQACQRYYEIGTAWGLADASNASVKSATANFAVQKRAVPTISGTLSHINGGGGSFSIAGFGANAYAVAGSTLVGGGAAGYIYRGDFSADAEL